MQKIFLLFLLFIFPFGVSANTFISKTISGNKIEVIKYSINSKNYDIKIFTTQNATSLKDILLYNNAISGVNGVFECPKDYSRCGGKSYTINERYVQGKKISTYKSTGDRVVFGWNKNLIPFLFQTDKINPEKESEIYEGFANFPLLLQNGKLMTEYYYEVNLIDKKMLSKQARNFICSDEKKENIYFGYIENVTLDEAGISLLELGCYNALNLDAGYSKAFIYNYEYLKGPGREILDGVFIKPKNIDFKKRKKELKNIVKKILSKFKNLSLNRKIEKIDSLIETLNNIYLKIYKKQTKDIFEIVNGKKTKTGKKTSFDNKNIINKIYTINMLKFYLYEINRIFKKINEIKRYDLNFKVEIGF